MYFIALHQVSNCVMKTGKTCYLLLFLLTFPLCALIRIDACEGRREGQWNQENVFAVLSEQGSGSSIGLGFYPRNHQRSAHHPEGFGKRWSKKVQLVSQDSPPRFSPLVCGTASTDSVSDSGETVWLLCKKTSMFLTLLAVMSASQTPRPPELHTFRIKQPDQLSHCDTTCPLWIARRCKHRYSCICPLPAISACTNVASSSKLVCFFFFWTDKVFDTISWQLHCVCELKEKCLCY